jgi:2-C-methyl-D-erythritol 4-phosphate cytidylyltransferase
MNKPGEVSAWAVIPAAGSGSRMQSEMPKQYLRFQGKTIIEHCLDRLLSHPAIDGAVLVLSENDRYWETLDYQAEKPLFIATGGAERQHSVYNGLALLQYRQGNEAIVLVHDAVRPLVRHADLDRLIDAARAHEAGAILAVPVADTLKIEGEHHVVSGTLPRDRLWRAQTPQAFHLQPLLNALKKLIDENRMVTDEAAAIEEAGFAPLLVEGSADNLKITVPADLALAEQVWLHQRDQHDHE